MTPFEKDESPLPDRTRRTESSTDSNRGRAGSPPYFLATKEEDPLEQLPRAYKLEGVVLDRLALMPHFKKSSETRAGYAELVRLSELKHEELLQISNKAILATAINNNQLEQLNRLWKESKNRIISQQTIHTVSDEIGMLSLEVLVFLVLKSMKEFSAWTNMDSRASTNPDFQDAHPIRWCYTDLEERWSNNQHPFLWTAPIEYQEILRQHNLNIERISGSLGYSPDFRILNLLAASMASFFVPSTTTPNQGVSWAVRSPRHYASHPLHQIPYLDLQDLFTLMNQIQQTLLKKVPNFCFTSDFLEWWTSMNQIKRSQAAQLAWDVSTGRQAGSRRGPSSSLVITPTPYSQTSRTVPSSPLLGRNRSTVYRRQEGAQADRAPPRMISPTTQQYYRERGGNDTHLTEEPAFRPPPRRRQTMDEASTSTVTAEGLILKEPAGGGRIHDAYLMENRPQIQKMTGIYL
ncbi:hypothetical protein T439DRAFT_376736 [Meredithblackwellia eburnea MCA 4105]